MEKPPILLYILLVLGFCLIAFIFVGAYQTYNSHEYQLQKKVKILKLEKELKELEEEKQNNRRK